MATQQLEKQQWSAFCNRLSQSLVGKWAEVEIVSLGLGDQIAAEWLPLLGIVYDPKDDVVEIALEGFDHLIHNPRDLSVDLGETGVQSLAVVDSGDVHHIVKLREPLMLPAATA